MSEKEFTFDHERLNVYQASIGFSVWLNDLALGNGVAACDQIARAASSISVNIAEASGKTAGNDRRHSIDVAYGSSLECAAALDILGIHGTLIYDQVKHGKVQLSEIVAMLLGFRHSTQNQVREETVDFGVDHNQFFFSHERLDVYRSGLALCQWVVENALTGPMPFQLLDRTSTSVVLNIAEGNGKFSTKDRGRFITQARTAALQMAAHLDVITIRKPGLKAQVATAKSTLADTVRMLVAWQKSLMSNT